MSIDTVTNTLWTYDCPGVEDTRGFLDLSQVDAGNANFQYYDQIWIQRAMTGEGKRGGPNNGATMYFYQKGFWTRTGTRGARPSPQDVLHVQHGTAPPSPNATPTPEATPTPTPTPAPTTGSYAHRSPDARTDSTGTRLPNRRRARVPAVPVVRARVAVWPKGQGVPQPPVTSGAAAS